MRQKFALIYFAIKAGSHYAANLLQPLIDSCELQKFPFFCSDLHQLQRPATLVKVKNVKQCCSLDVWIIAAKSSPRNEREEPKGEQGGQEEACNIKRDYNWLHYIQEIYDLIL